MTEYQLDPNTWFGDRELQYTPKHFTITSTPFSSESKIWVLNTFKGRFSTVYWSSDDSTSDPLSLNSVFGKPAFEDPHEAVIFELTWA